MFSNAIQIVLRGCRSGRESPRSFSSSISGRWSGAARRERIRPSRYDGGQVLLQVHPLDLFDLRKFELPDLFLRVQKLEIPARDIPSKVETPHLSTASIESFRSEMASFIIPMAFSQVSRSP